MNKTPNQFRSPLPHLGDKKIFVPLLILLPAITFASGHGLDALFDLFVIAAMFIGAIICLITFALARAYRSSQSSALAAILFLLNLLLIYIILGTISMVKSEPSYEFSEGITSRNSILTAICIPIITVLYSIWVAFKKREVL